jgi:hypothetical protein
MEKFRRIEPGSAARMAESEPRAASRSISPGSAAKAAEDAARNAEPRVPGTAYRGSIGVTIGVATGKRFEFPESPQGPGEALPIVAAEQKSAEVELSGPKQPGSSDATTQAPITKASGIFRRLFRR